MRSVEEIREEYENIVEVLVRMCKDDESHSRYHYIALFERAYALAWVLGIHDGMINGLLTTYNESLEFSKRLENIELNLEIKRSVEFIE